LDCYYGNLLCVVEIVFGQPGQWNLAEWLEDVCDALTHKGWE